MNLVILSKDISECMRIGLKVPKKNYLIEMIKRNELLATLDFRILVIEYFQFELV